MQLSKVTVILRGYNYDQVEMVASVIAQSKIINNIEITLNTKDALSIIEKISNKYKDVLNVGAGTVLTMSELKAAIAAGAMFILSPVVMDKQMIDYCIEHDVIAIPGATTPSEVYCMHNLGASIIKLFPSNEFSYSYANKIIEPLGNIQLMAVGGVNHSTVNSYLDGGYSHVGSAGGIFNKVDIVNMDESKLLQSLRDFENILKKWLNLMDVNET